MHISSNSGRGVKPIKLTISRSESFGGGEGVRTPAPTPSRDYGLFKTRITLRKTVISPKKKKKSENRLHKDVSYG